MPHTFQWIYGTPVSGLTFSLFTLSGTVAVYPNTAFLSTVISKNGAAVAATTNKCSGTRRE